MHCSNDKNLCDVSLASPPRCENRRTSFSSLKDTLLRLSISHSLASLPLGPTQTFYSSKVAGNSSSNLSLSAPISPGRADFRKSGGLVTRVQPVSSHNPASKMSPTQYGAPSGPKTPAKRPGDYFSSKLAAQQPPASAPSSSIPHHNSTGVHTPAPHTASAARDKAISSTTEALTKIRPRLDGSLLSSSDDQSLGLSLQFDRSRSRENSWVGSLGSESFVESPFSKNFGARRQSADSTEIYREGADEELESILELSTNTLSWKSHIDESQTTITPSRDSTRKVSDPCNMLLAGKGPLPNIPMRAASTSSIMQKPSIRRSNTLAHRPAPALKKLYGALNSSAAPPSLFRSKSGSYSAKDSKERLQFRKKVYEEFCDDDDIMPNDVEHLVFNVPVIKNPHTLYHLNLTSSINVSDPKRSTLKRMSEPALNKPSLSRRDLMMNDGDTKYAGAQQSRSVSHPKPFPLPGRIDTSMLHRDDVRRPLHLNPLSGARLSVSASNEDAQITHNISSFYNQQVEDHFDHTRRERSPNAFNIIPSYVKSQSSLDDMHLISAEKLKVLDQSRPIHLPPKAEADKQKHHKEISDSIASYQSATRQLSEVRRRLAELQLSQQALGAKLVQSLMAEEDARAFNKRFGYERKVLRKLVWTSSIPHSMLFSFFIKILLSNASTSNTLLNIGLSFDLFKENYAVLTPTIRASKDAEFSYTITRTLERPLIKSLLTARQDSDPDFSTTKFQDDLRFMMYIKSLSEEGLQTYQETFMLPVLLIMFSSRQLLRDIFCLLELVEQQVLTREVFTLLSVRMASWTENASIPSLKDFDKSEFEGLDANAVFEILLQLNDNLPLSLSAACTPVQAHFFIPEIAHPPATPSEGSQRSSMDTMELTKADSSAWCLVSRLLLVLIIYSNARKTRRKHILAVLESMMLTIFQFYHINWNSHTDLVRQNESIRLNKSSDHLENLMSFSTKWANAFKTL